MVTLDYTRTSTDAAFQYATGDTFDIAVRDGADNPTGLKSAYALVLNTTFTGTDGNVHDFRGYQLDLLFADAPGSLLRAVISGDPNNPTTYRVFYTAKTDMTFKVHYITVDGAGNVVEKLTEVRHGQTDTTVDPGVWGLAYEDKVNTINGTLSGSILTVNDLPGGTGTDYTYNFKGFRFFPNASGFLPGTTLQTSAPGIILGTGATEFYVYYEAIRFDVLLHLGDDASTDMANRTWSTGSADISGKFAVGATITLPSAADANRLGYELVGWYSGDKHAAYTNLVGYESVQRTQDLANAGTVDGYGIREFIPAGGTFTMPQGDIEFWAVWRAKQISFTVERWQIESGADAKKLTTATYSGYAGDVVNFLVPRPNGQGGNYTMPTTTRLVYEIDASGNLVIKQIDDGSGNMIDATTTTEVGAWTQPTINGYHLYGTNPLDVPADATDSLGVDYSQRIVYSGTIEEIFGMPTGKPTITLVYVPDATTQFIIEHWLVKGDGSEAQIMIPATDTDPAKPYLTYGMGKTGQFIDATTGASYALVAPDPHITGYTFGTYAKEKLTGTITADGKMTLKLYYLADRIQLNFELGTKNPADGTYNNGAWWRGDDPSTNIYRSGEKITLPNPTAGIRPGYVLHGWYISNDGNFTDPVDGSVSVPCDLSGIVTREWINAYSNSIFPARAQASERDPGRRHHRADRYLRSLRHDG